MREKSLITGFLHPMLHQGESCGIAGVILPAPKRGHRDIFGFQTCWSLTAVSFAFLPPLKAPNMETCSTQFYLILSSAKQPEESWLWMSFWTTEGNARKSRSARDHGSKWPCPLRDFLLWTRVKDRAGLLINGGWQRWEDKQYVEWEIQESERSWLDGAKA